MANNKQKQLLEMISPDVSDVHIPQPLGKKKKKMNDDEGVVNMSGIPIFKSGVWKDDLVFDISTLDEIVKNTNALITAGVIEPPVKLGHNEEQTLLQSDGYPAAGYVTQVYRVGNQIFADVKDMPKKIADLIEKRAYSKISAELYQEFKHPETQENLGYVLRAIAFLGADIPEVKGIGDITRLYNSEKQTANVLSFAEDTKNFKEVSQMRTWTLKEVESILPCCVEEVKKFLEANKKDVLTVDELATIVTEVKIAKMQEEQDKAEKIECPEGYKWDEAKGKCVKLQEEQDDKTTSEQIICPKGYKWDEKLNKCVPVEVTKEGENKKDKDIIEDEISDDEITDEYAELVFAKKKAELKPEEVKKLKEILKYTRKNKKEADKQEADKQEAEANKQDDVNIVIPDDDGIKEIENNPEYKSWGLGKMLSKGKAIDEITKESEGVVGFPWPENRRPPKAWWDKCISSVNGKTATPEKLCGWVWYHGTSTASKKEAISKESEQDKKVIELKEKIKKLEQEKIKEKINELKTKNRGILLPKFDEYINKFTELFLSEEKVIKFGENDFNAVDLFYKFLNDIVKSKTVIFSELSKNFKAESENIEINDTDKQNLAKKFSEVSAGREVSNIDVATLAKKIAETRKLSMRDAVVEATKKLFGKEN